MPTCGGRRSRWTASQVRSLQHSWGIHEAFMEQPPHSTAVLAGAGMAVQPTPAQPGAAADAHVARAGPSPCSMPALAALLAPPPCKPNYCSCWARLNLHISRLPPTCRPRAGQVHGQRAGHGLRLPQRRAFLRHVPPHGGDQGGRLLFEWLVKHCFVEAACSCGVDIRLGPRRGGDQGGGAVV